MREPEPGTSLEDAQILALRALAFLAVEPGRLTRFLQLTGLELAELTASAGSVPIQAAILEHVLSDESLLLVFASETGLDPAHVGRAQRVLAGAHEPL